MAIDPVNAGNRSSGEDTLIIHSFAEVDEIWSNFWFTHEFRGLVLISPDICE